MRTIIVLFLFFTFQFKTSAQTVHYVDVGKADNTGNGLTWATAKRDIQNAVNDCVTGDEVWIKAGTYTPTSYPATYTFNPGNTALSTRDYAIFVLKDNLKIYGGFAGTETAITQRVYAQNQTIIDGNIGSVSTSTDNCYHVLVYIGPSTGSQGITLDGIKFINGYANGNGNFDAARLPAISGYTSSDDFPGRNFGGGVFLVRGANSKINNCTFSGCYSYNRGGGLWFDGGFGNTYGTTISNTVFELNTSLNYGAGASFLYGTNRLYNCVFAANTSTAYGTAIAFFQGNNTLSNNTIAYNSTTYGSMLCVFNGGTIKVNNSIFWGNTLNGSTTTQGVDFTKTPPSLQATQYVTSVFKNNIMQLPANLYDSTSSTFVSYHLGIGSLNNSFATSPLFSDSLDINGPDNIYGTADDGLFLTNASPAVNSGDNTLLPSTYSLDISNNSRIVTTTVDKGAYEYVCITPTINSSPVSSSACIGSSISFSVAATGATKYKWYKNGTAISNATLSALNFNSLAAADAGTYSVSAIACGTVTSNAFSITVNAAPTLSINNGAICPGFSHTFSPSGAFTYTYSSGNAIVSPSATTNYTILGMSAQGCTNTAIGSVTVNASPTIAVNSGSICSGASFVIVPNGANTYTVSGGSSTVSPIANTSYSVTGTSTAGCVSTNTAVATVSVIARPTVSVSSGAICSGASYTIIPSGASTYTFSGGSAVVAPTSNSTYSVTGTSSVGCVSSNTAVSSITVNALPTVSVNSGTICAGNSFTLVPSGASTYTFSSGSAVVSPNTSTVYTIIGTNTLGCVSSNTAVSSVTVHALPTVAVNSASICLGSSFTISPSGASTYTISGGSAVVSPIVNTTYSVTGTSSLGCVSASAAISSVVIKALPSLSIAVSNVSVCLGNTSTLTVAGATTYTWNTNSTSNSIVVSPSIASTYTVVGTNTLGCSNSTIQTIGVFPSPSITISSSSPSICVGKTATLVASGVSTYTWNTGSTNANINSSPSINTTYSVTGTDLNTCIAKNALTIFVNVNPTISAVTSQTSICSGNTATLSASGTSSYVWNTNASTAAIAVSPSVSSAYTVTGTNALGCSDTKTLNLIVYATPTVSAGSDEHTFRQDQYTLNGHSNAVSYTWSPASYLNNANSLTPNSKVLITTTYTLFATSAEGCINSSTVTITVHEADLKIANYISPNNDGQNDTWKVNDPLLIKDMAIDIVDQWGNKVYSVANNYNNEWDATKAGTNLPDGVYYYIISENGKMKFTGSITVLR